jgi:hypothetical protein
MDIQAGGKSAPSYIISYRNGETDSVIFTFGKPTGAEGNSARPDARERVQVHGVSAELLTSSGSPRFSLIWKEGTFGYQVLVMGQATTREELMRIVNGLIPVSRSN